MTHLLITGAGGQLGREFQVLAQEFPEFSFTAADRQTLDISKAEAVNRFFGEHPVDFCINCAAYTAVDRAESEPEMARLINVDATRHLAEACARQGAPFIHFSTDYVYHNYNKNTPFRETDEPSPQGVYARTKLDGEFAALAAHAQSMIIRTSWVYSSFGHNFYNTMLRLGSERQHLRVVFDQIGTPTYARDLADAVLRIIKMATRDEKPLDTLSGIYHYSNEGVCSWYDFALAIFEKHGIPCTVAPIETSDYPTPARRPPFSVLNKAKIKETFGIDIAHWQAALSHCAGHKAQMSQ